MLFRPLSLPLRMPSPPLRMHPLIKGRRKPKGMAHRHTGGTVGPLGDPPWWQRGTLHMWADPGLDWGQDKCSALRFLFFSFFRKSLAGFPLLLQPSSRSPSLATQPLADSAQQQPLPEWSEDSGRGAPPRPHQGSTEPSLFLLRICMRPNFLHLLQPNNRSLLGLLAKSKCSIRLDTEPRRLLLNLSGNV